jgi:predicted MFS family arabinose efflux permease
MTGSTAAEESLLRGYAGNQLVLVTTGTLTFTTGRFLLPPLLPEIIEVLAISDFQAGLAMSVMFGLTALSRYPGGRLSDDLNRKTVLVASLGVIVLGFGLFATVGSYPVFLLAVTATGIGVGLYTAAAVARLSDLFVERQGQALGINNGSIYLAGVLGAGVASLVLGLGEWRAAFIPIALVLLGLLVSFSFLSRERYVIARPRLDVVATFVRIFRSPTARRMLVIGALFGVAWQGVITFLPRFLQLEKSLAPTDASNLFALLFVVGIGANLLGGRLADRFDVPYLVAVVASVATVGLGVVITASSTPVVVAGIVVLGAGLAAIWPALQSYMMGQFPKDSKGGDYGAFSASYVGVASLGPSIVGYVAEATSYTVAFVGLAGCLLCSTVLALLLARR